MQICSHMAKWNVGNYKSSHSFRLLCCQGVCWHDPCSCQREGSSKSVQSCPAVKFLSWVEHVLRNQAEYNMNSEYFNLWNTYRGNHEDCKIMFSLEFMCLPFMYCCSLFFQENQISHTSNVPKLWKCRPFQCVSVPCPVVLLWTVLWLHLFLCDIE